MNHSPRIPHRILVLAATLLSPLAANAQGAGEWQYAATINVYLPSIGGSSKFPADGGSSINVDGSRILDNLQSAFMGSLDIHNGPWGGFADVLYLNVNAHKSQSRDFSLGDAGIPAGTTADLDYDLKGSIWTLAGQYRIHADPQLKMDVLFGARYYGIKQTLGYSISGSLGPLTPAGRSGRNEIDDSVWDAIVGVKGRYDFGEGGKWFVPFYVDVGTGQSDFTWQATVGLAYAFQWGDVSASYRYIDYKFKSSSKVEDMNFSGPQIGATFRW